MDAMTFPRRTFLHLALGSAALPAVARIAGAQPYPSRAIKIIAPVAAGTVADLVPRLIAENLAARWGHPIVVENRPGGATNIGTEAAARAEPDGYTLLVSPATALVVNQSLYPKLPFDPAAFVPVTVLADQPNVLVARSTLPVSNAKELIAYAKDNPGKLSFASSGMGTVQHLGMEQLKTMTGIDIVHVPYRGLAPALNDLVAGHVDLMLDNLGTSAPHIKNGTLKGIALGSERRNPLLPEIPAMSETVPGFVSTTWFAIVAPPKTPGAIADQLFAAVTEVLKLPEVRSRLRDLYAEPVGDTPAETAAFFTRERARWQKVIEAARVKPQ
jgi:tripartite-type tricarboxylate transporter receptor subunit TctC